ncbi:unnamed protein product [Darwinula stevensoni]|uniref:Beta-1,4-glucuronyltransferase 1 n=1 Tax=Darwinula stevensoni TaxID=69355 RepID=A0A7R9A5Y4_9CRUS|nr:unnamed protein product [Darwinula stevensoni]CAG0895455.1 unnamed protein product [Darwinula stevensoni]
MRVLELATMTSARSRTSEDERKCRTNRPSTEAFCFRDETAPPAGASPTERLGMQRRFRTAFASVTATEAWHVGTTVHGSFEESMKTTSDSEFRADQSGAEPLGNGREGSGERGGRDMSVPSLITRSPKFSRGHRRPSRVEWREEGEGMREGDVVSVPEEEESHNRQLHSGMKTELILRVFEAGSGEWRLGFRRRHPASVCILKWLAYLGAAVLVLAFIVDTKITMVALASRPIPPFGSMGKPFPCRRQNCRFHSPSSVSIVKRVRSSALSIEDSLGPPANSDVHRSWGNVMDDAHAKGRAMDASPNTWFRRVAHDGGRFQVLRGESIAFRITRVRVLVGDINWEAKMKETHPETKLDDKGHYGILLDAVPASMPTPPTPDDVTWVSSCPVERLHRVAAIVAAWQGPVSLVVFLSTPANANATLRIIGCMRKSDKRIARNVAFHLVFPVRRTTDEPDLPDGLRDPSCRNVLDALPKAKAKKKPFGPQWDVEYPYALMRNAGRTAAKTKFVLEIDVEFLPNPGLRAGFLRFARGNRLFSPEKDEISYVVPAFEKRVGTPMPADKAELMKLWKEGKIRPFNDRVSSLQQKGTWYKRWRRLPPSDEISAAFQANWHYMYEPFVIWRNSAPRYDERFRQYGWDRANHVKTRSLPSTRSSRHQLKKLSIPFQMCSAHVAGFDLFVLDNAFVIHDGFRGEDSASRERMREELKRKTLVNLAIRAEEPEKYHSERRSCGSRFLYFLEFLYVAWATLP